jgi:hypothetical protein
MIGIGSNRRGGWSDGCSFLPFREQGSHPAYTSHTNMRNPGMLCSFAIELLPLLLGRDHACFSSRHHLRHWVVRSQRLPSGVSFLPAPPEAPLSFEMHRGLHCSPVLTLSNMPDQTVNLSTSRFRSVRSSDAPLSTVLKANLHLRSVASYNCAEREPK